MANVQLGEIVFFQIFLVLQSTKNVEETIFAVDWKGDATWHCAMGNVDQTFCSKLLSTKQSFDLFFSHFCDINHSSHV
jgi:hypothetical protein